MFPPQHFPCVGDGFSDFDDLVGAEHPFVDVPQLILDRHQECVGRARGAGVDVQKCSPVVGSFCVFEMCGFRELTLDLMDRFHGRFRDRVGRLLSAHPNDEQYPTKASGCKTSEGTG